MNKNKNWILSLKKGDKKAFRLIYNRFANKIFYTALRFHLTEDEAKDMVQSVFLELWERRENLKESLSLNAYLLTITKNKIINLQKRKAIEIASNREYVTGFSDLSSETEDDIIFNEMEKQTLQFIESLPNRHKQIFLLSRIKGLKNEEIADQLFLSKRTVENNVYQAEIAIRHYLKCHKILERSFIFLLAFVNL